jgi:hypothetical protein
MAKPTQVQSYSLVKQSGKWWSNLLLGLLFFIHYNLSLSCVALCHVPKSNEYGKDNICRVPNRNTRDIENEHDKRVKKHKAKIQARQKPTQIQRKEAK